MAGLSPTSVLDLLVLAGLFHTPGASGGTSGQALLLEASSSLFPPWQPDGTPREDLRYARPLELRPRAGRTSPFCPILLHMAFCNTSLDSKGRKIDSSS